MQPRPAAVAMPDGKIDVVADKVDVLRRGAHTQTDFGITFGKAAETVDLDEAYCLGQMALNLAATGQSGFMATILRTPL